MNLWLCPTPQFISFACQKEMNQTHLRRAGREKGTGNSLNTAVAGTAWPCQATFRKNVYQEYLEIESSMMLNKSVKRRTLQISNNSTGSRTSGEI